MIQMKRTYSELITIPTFEERFRYLKMDGVVGQETYGFERYLNQAFYKSHEWKRVRDEVIVRDMGRDLGCKGRELHGRIIVHHMNPIMAKDIVNGTDILLNPEYLICTCKRTHDAIHYSDETILYTEPIIRRPGDTWPCGSNYV